MRMAARRGPGLRPGSPSTTPGGRQALGGQAPLAVWRAGTSGALGAKAVDLTLRLDNAGALPTGPQLNEQQQAPRGLILEEVGDGSESNYEPPRRGPTHGVLNRTGFLG